MGNQLPAVTSCCPSQRLNSRNVVVTLNYLMLHYTFEITTKSPNNKTTKKPKPQKTLLALQATVIG